MAEASKNSGQENLQAPQYQAKIINDQPVANTEPILGSNDVDKIGARGGVEMDDSEELAMKAKLEARDEERWELNPDSAADNN